MKTVFVPGQVYVPISGQHFVMFVLKVPHVTPYGTYLDVVWEDGNIARRVFAYEASWRQVT
jgi:hypothetical protein